MGYRNLRECVNDLARTGQLLRIDAPVDPYLEAAEIHRRVYQAGGPAIFFANVKGCQFPLVSNLFGTLERARFLFRDSLEAVRRLIELKIDPSAFWRRPVRYIGVPRTALCMRPNFLRGGPVLANETTIEALPQVTNWPGDGGPFVTLPVVYTEDAEQPGWRRSNLGMYRVQLGGNQYRKNAEVGLHYQIHRGIGVHHAAAIRRGVPFRANIFVGGPPAMMLGAVMPLPEGLAEIAFAGALGRRRVPLVARPEQLPIHAEADFCISGTVDPDRLLPEGPFGDHLGYYSLAHDFPVLNVHKVYHREAAIWPFTVVGRPPQEDTIFGQLIHELTGPIIPTVIPGVKAVHAVDAAGVHPLLLAIGSERYTPFADAGRPQELLTQANAILGQGQLSLAKYLWIVAGEDDATLDIHDVEAFFRHVLQRVDWRRDVHFQTETTIDTLDYSGSGFNAGSKVVIAAIGPARRPLATEIPGDLNLPDGFRDARVCLPGILAVTAPKHEWVARSESSKGVDLGLASSVASRPSQTQGVPPDLDRFCRHYTARDSINHFSLVVLVDDAEFTARTLANFLWVTFTRSNPAADIDGIESFTEQKHWGCRGSLVIDARIKPHHAPPLVEDAEVSRRVDALGARGGPLFGVI
jgi:4-hydroxy-3-polyprenylbenzoate decarboxylase